MAFGDIVSSGIDLFSGNKASNIARRATRKAGAEIEKGYGQSLDLAKPMQERSQADYMNLSDKYREGGFRNPDQQVYQGGEYRFNPQDVFNDPEYKASMQAGTQAIESGAAGKGMLFSGNTGRALQKYGQDLFAGRSDELYGRGRQAFESDRGFGFNAANRAYDTNAANRALDFSQGAQLANYAPGMLDRNIDLNLGRAQGRSDTELGVGNIRANAWREGGGKLGDMFGSAIDMASPYFQKGMQKKAEKGLY